MDFCSQGRCVRLKGLQLARLRFRTNYHLPYRVLLIVLTGENAGKASATVLTGDSLALGGPRGCVRVSRVMSLQLLMHVCMQ
jgi:hypothetical protein